MMGGHTTNPKTIMKDARTDDMHLSKSSSANEGTSVKRKTKTKSMKPKKIFLDMTVGKDILIDDILTYLKLALVGRFYSKNLGNSALEAWMERNWNPIFVYTLKFHILPRGWFLIKMEKEEDNSLLLRQS